MILTLFVVMLQSDVDVKNPDVTCTQNKTSCASKACYCKNVPTADPNPHQHCPHPHPLTQHHAYLQYLCYGPPLWEQLQDQDQRPFDGQASRRPIFTDLAPYLGKDLAPDEGLRGLHPERPCHTLPISLRTLVHTALPPHPPHPNPVCATCATARLLSVPSWLRVHHRGACCISSWLPMCAPAFCCWLAGLMLWRASLGSLRGI